MKPSDIAKALNVAIEKKRPVFIWGPPGVGKSAVARQVADSQCKEFRDVRMSLLDPVDLKGFPVPDTVKKVMSWLPPDFLPPMTVKKGSKEVPNESEGVLFLDEMNSAPPSVQAAGYQLILDRRIGEYVLPDGWSIIAAGNRASDRSVVHAMPAALANRFIHLDFEVNLDDFSDWALKNGIHEEVLAFLRFKSNLLHSFDAASNPRAFPSPRSWMFVNDIIKNHLPPAVEREVLKGTVGEGAAGEFLTFLNVYRELPHPDVIMLKPKEAPVPGRDKPAVLYALTTSLAIRATPDNFDILMQYTSRLPEEFQVVFVRDSVRRDESISKSKAFTNWAVKNHEVLT
jgi:hypothetical protein